MIIKLFIIVGLIIMNKYTLQRIKDIAYKDNVIIHDDKSVSVLIQIVEGRFIIKQYYPLDWLFYTDNEDYKIEFIAKKNNLTKEKYISILDEEKRRVKEYFINEEKPKKVKENKLTKKQINKEQKKEDLLNLLRKNAKQ